MKAKRAIAVLLALMLIVGMLPLSAFAAENRYTIADTTVTLRSTKNFGSMTMTRINMSSFQPEDKVVSDLATYTSMGTGGEVISSKVTPEDTSKVVEYNKILADRAKETTVRKGDTFYITVKVTSDEANGIMPVNAIITYDGTAFTPGNKATVNALQRNGYLATNRVEITEEGSYKGKTFGSNMLDANLTAITENETGDSLLILPYTYNGNEYHTENPATEWDYVIPFTANEVVSKAEFNIKVYQKGQTGKLSPDGMKIMIPKSKITGDGTATLSADTDLITFVGQDGYEGVKGDPTFVTVEDPSAKPGADPEKYQDKITNIPNYPYVTVASDENATNYMDTLTFPAEENVFVEGDTVIFYAAKKTGEDTYEKGEELGRTWLTATDGAAGGTTGVFTESLSAGASVAGKTVYLLGYDSENNTWQHPGYGYLKGESKVFLARLETGKDPSEAIGPIDIDPEDPVHYTGNSSYVKKDTDPGYSADAPIEIKLGDTVADVLARVNGGAAAVAAPYENSLGNTVAAPLKAAWNSAALYDGSLDGLTQAGVDTATGEYCKHGDFLLVNPYQNTTADMPDGTQVAVEQPTEYWTSPSQIPAAGYGQVIYVRVLPNPADYYLARTKPDGGNNTLYVLGKTKQYMTDGDRIRLFNKDTSSTIASMTFGSTDANNGYYRGSDLDDSDGSLPAVGEKVLLAYTNAPLLPGNKNESEKVEIPVTDGKTSVVASDVELRDETYGTYYINTTTNWAGLVNRFGDATFTVVGPVDGTITAQNLVLPKASILSWTTGANEDKLNVTETTTPRVYEDEVSGPTGDELLKADLLNAQKTPLREVTAGAKYDASFVIPASDGGVAVMKEDGVTPYTGVYTNLNEYAISLAAASDYTITFAGDLKIEVTENKPLGQRDTVVISGDTDGSLYDNWADVTSEGGHYGSYYLGLFDEAGNEVGRVDRRDGFHDAQMVSPVSAGDPTTYTYTVYVTQTARNKGTKLTMRSVNPGGGNARVGQLEVGLQEEYALFGVNDPAPKQVQLLKDDILTFLGSAVTDPDTYAITKTDILNYLAAPKTAGGTVTNAATLGLTGPQRRFGYCMTSGSGNSTITVADPSATYTEEVKEPFADAKWSAPDGAVFEPDAAQYTTLTFSNGANNENILKDDPADRRDPAATLPINVINGLSNLTPAASFDVKVVSQKYTNDPVTPASVASSAKIENNPYPQEDVLKLKKEDGKDYTGVTAVVSVNGVNVGTVNFETATADAEGYVDITPAAGKEDKKTLLDSMGGKVSVSLQKPGFALSDAAETSYNAEDYILWSTTDITPTTVGLRSSELTDPTVDTVTAKLPKTMTAIAAHLTAAPGGSGVEPKPAENKKFTVTVDKWYNRLTGAEISDALFANAKNLEADASRNYYLVAEYNIDKDVVYVEGDVTSKQLLITNNNGAAQDVKVLNPADITGVTAPANYNRSNTVTLNIGGDNVQREKTLKPAGTVVKVTKGPKDYKDASAQEIEIRVPSANIPTSGFDAANTHAILKYLDDANPPKEHFFVTAANFGGTANAEGNVVVTVKQGEAVLTGFADPEDSLLAAATFDTTFAGLDSSGGTVEAWLIETDSAGTPTKNKSDSATDTYDKAEAALQLTDDIMLANVHLTAGSLSTNQAVLDLVSGYKEASTTIGSQNVTIPLVTSGSPPAVSWTLKKSSTGEPAADAETISDNFADALKTVPTDGGYYLEAALNAGAAYDGTPTNLISVNSGNKVAFVKLSLYTNYDPDDPTKMNRLQLTEGNSDLWAHGAEADSLAHKELVRRGDITDSTSADDIAKVIGKYRTDTIFYYHWDAYDTATSAYTTPVKGLSVKPYADPANAAANIKSITPVGETTPLTGDALTAWLADAVITVEQIDVTDGTEKPVSITMEDGSTSTNIEPSHSSTASDYFVFNQSVSRFVENYVIRYTVTKGKDVYTVDRSVKLTYQPGDLQPDNEKTPVDTEYENEVVASFKSIFIAPSGAEADIIAAYDELSNYVADPNGDYEKTPADTEKVVDYVNFVEFTKRRW